MAEDGIQGDGFEFEEAVEGEFVVLLKLGNDKKLRCGCVQVLEGSSD
jgi:hypothetical protein